MLLAEHAGIPYCDLEMLVQGFSLQTLAFLKDRLERIGASRGLFLKSDGLEDIPLGRAEGLGPFLNDTDLPAEVDAGRDVNEVIAACAALMEGVGAFRGHWDGTTETALFSYGESYAAMKAAVAEFTDTYTLCARCRFEQVA